MCNGEKVISTHYQVIVLNVTKTCFMIKYIIKLFAFLIKKF